MFGYPQYNRSVKLESTLTFLGYYISRDTKYASNVFFRIILLDILQHVVVPGELIGGL